MFWRNTIEPAKDLNAYLDDPRRTNYTYSDSYSYRSNPLINVVEKPRLMRNGIYSDTTNHSENSADMKVRNSIKSKSLNETPNTMKINSDNSDRILRSGKSIKHDDYMYKYLNTNTNNPDDGDKPWITSEINSNTLSDVDEPDERESDYLSYSTEPKYGTNNANSRRPNYREKLNKHWFQKNMFGLPSEDSDNSQNYGSGTISGDEQYDLEQLNTNTTNKHNHTKRHKHGSRSTDSYSKMRTSNFNIMTCSPTAILFYIIKSIFNYMQLIYTNIINIITKIKVSGTQLTKNTVQFITCFPVYILNKFNKYAKERVTIENEYKSKKGNIKKSSHLTRIAMINNYMMKLFLNVIWFGLLFLIIFLLFVWLFNSESANTSHYTQQIVNGLIKIPDDHCMQSIYQTNSLLFESQQSQFLLIKRALYCIVSFPIRWTYNFTKPCALYVVNSFSFKEDEQVSSIPIQSGIVVEKNEKLVQYDSTERLVYIENILKSIQSKLSIQENELDNLKKKSNEKYTSLNDDQNDIKSIKKLMDQLQSEMKTIRNEINNLNQSVKKITKDQSTNYDNVNLSFKNFKTQMESDINNMKIQIQKLEKSINQYEESLLNSKTLLKNLNLNIVGIKGDVKSLFSKTETLEKQKDSFLKESAQLKIEMNKKLELLEKENEKIRGMISKEVSELENKVNQYMESRQLKTNDNHDNAKVDEKHVNKLIQDNLNNIRVNIHDQINSSIWDSVITKKITETVRNLLPKSDNSRTTGRSKPCGASFCRCYRCLPSSTQCMRLLDVRRTVDEALQTFAADRIGLADFALESAGGTIASTRCTETYTDRAAILTIFGLPLIRLTNSPRTIIQPSMNPGECWAMKGSRGTVVIQLSGTVKVNAISIDHIPKSLSPSGTIESALKDFEIKALENEKDTIGVSLGNFTYQIDSDPIQTFQTESYETNFIEVLIKSNYGHEEYTCIYRIRVHGHLIRY